MKRRSNSTSTLPLFFFHFNAEFCSVKRVSGEFLIIFSKTGLSRFSSSCVSETLVLAQYRFNVADDYVGFRFFLLFAS